MKNTEKGSREKPKDYDSDLTTFEEFEFLL